MRRKPLGIQTSSQSEHRRDDSIVDVTTDLTNRKSALPIEVNIPTNNKEMGAAAKLNVGLDLTKARVADIESGKKNVEFAKKALPVLGGLQSGLAAGTATVPVTDSGGAVLQTVGAGLTGAIGGAAVGTAFSAPGMIIGAGVGGLVGLVSGGINSYLGMKQARQQKRREDAKIREIKRMNAIARQDAARQDAENRRMRAVQARWDAYQYAQNRMGKLLNTDENLKEIFINRTR